MDPWTWIAVSLGLALVAFTWAAIAVTILHPDAEGPLELFLQRTVAVTAARLERRTGSRGMVAVAGPVMMIGTVVSWLTTFVVGVALVVWPNLSDYRSAPGLDAEGFLDAVYYSGVTAAVLGYGDLTPLTGPLKLLAVATSVGGFAILTGAVTYLIQVQNSLHERNRLALEVRDAAAGSDGPSEALGHWVSLEGTAAVRERLDRWATLVRGVQDRLQRFPLVALCYRSRDPRKDPEAAIDALVVTAVAADVLSSQPRFEELRPAATRLRAALERLVEMLAQQYVVGGRVTQLFGPSGAPPGQPDGEGRGERGEQEAADAEDRRRFERVTGALDDAGLLTGAVPPDVARRGRETLARTRGFLDDLDLLTAWRTHARVLDSASDPGSRGRQPGGESAGDDGSPRRSARAHR